MTSNPNDSQTALYHDRPFVLDLFINSAIVAIPEPALDLVGAFLPALLTAVLIQPDPVRVVDSGTVDILRGALSNITYNKNIAKIVESLNVTEIRADLIYLSGEEPGSSIMSRNSMSSGALAAANWLQEQFEGYGASCEQIGFRDGWAPNVICDYPGTDNSTGVIILGAHYDSRGRPFPDRAPGADDDGSGTAHLLAIARGIKNHNVQFKSNVRIAAFAGEEQGLVGSRAYAKYLRAQDANVTLMIQADMLAYHDPSEPMQLGQPDRYALPEANQLIANVSRLYAPELTLGWTDGCCTDHQSFTEQGFPATSVFERGLDGGDIVDPMYHTSYDLVDRPGVDLEQLRSISKVVFAALLHVSGYELGSSKLE
ncbi:Zn-dependent exopeptidase [Exidia glandulosa HHB12029]|uniref:Peptide hydrolase n=1 Tax=Exidia glandulosa HHB12029 TaxID=1314781 RepID=A0A166AUB1_EXIGL|nr:Zn-dependent exopeptidase [Exidia glandulosa HHB12029]